MVLLIRASGPMVSILLPTEKAMVYDLQMTKKMGFNMLRKHVKVENRIFYYWCDKLGILVWQDMPSGDKSIGGISRI